MKYWNQKENIINLKDEDYIHNNRIISISILDDDEVMFMEETSKYYAVIYNRKEAINCLKEAIKFIEKHERIN